MAPSRTLGTVATLLAGFSLAACAAAGVNKAGSPTCVMDEDHPLAARFIGVASERQALYTAIGEPVQLADKTRYQVSVMNNDTGLYSVMQIDMKERVCKVHNGRDFGPSYPLRIAR